MTNREQIIAAADDAGFDIKADEYHKSNEVVDSGNLWITSRIETLYAIAFEAGRKSIDTEFALAEAYRCGEEAGRQAEREACAVVCDYHGDDDNGYGCAAAIRARSTK